MNLEEAIGRIKRMITVRSIMKLENLIDSDADIEYIKNADAVEIILQEIERLQKEKSEYEARWNNTAHELRIFKNECVPKNKIREKIEEITDKYNRIYKFPSPKVEKTPEGQLIYKIRFNTDSEALRIVKVILEELLEEE